MKENKTIAHYAEILTKADSIIRRLERDFLRALSLKSICTELGTNDDLYKVASYKKGTQGFNLINSAVTESYIMCLIRMFDRTGSDRASLETLLSIFKSNDFLNAHYIEDASTWPGDTDTNIELVKNKLEVCFQKIQNLSENLEISTKISAVKEFRDYEIGHALIKRRSHDVKYHYMDDLVDIAHEIIPDMYLCMTGINSNYEEYERIYKKHALDFAQTLTKGFEQENKN